MKQIFITTTIALATIFNVNAQQDERAKQILDEVSAKTASYSTITLAFKMSTKGENINETMNGTAKIKGDMYYLDLEGQQERFSNGQKVWIYLEDDNECYVESANNSDDFITPSRLLTLWEDGFKSQFVKETETTQTINLFPTNPKESKFHTVMLIIDKQKKQVKSAVIKGKNGITLSYILTNLEPNKDIPDSAFVFDKSKHPGVTIIED